MCASNRDWLAYALILHSDTKLHLEPLIGGIVQPTLSIPTGKLANIYRKLYSVLIMCTDLYLQVGAMDIIIIIRNNACPYYMGVS